MHKIFVKVNTGKNRQGDILPVSVLWSDGNEYRIDEVREAKRYPGGSYAAGTRYDCRLLGKPVYLYYENGGWYFEGKATE